MAKSNDFYCNNRQNPRSAILRRDLTSQRTDVDQGYDQMAQRMIALAFQMPGFLGVESVRSADRLGITVSYWRSEDAIRRWKTHSAHTIGQEAGRNMWYSDYVLRVAKVERAYGMITDY